jgi:hypothetical protein
MTTHTLVSEVADHLDGPAFEGTRPKSPDSLQFMSSVDCALGV